MKIAVKDPTNNTHWVVNATLRVVRRYDNSRLISCGWIVGEDLPRSTFNRLTKTALTQEQYNHSGCLSYCVLRGHNKCSW